MAREGVEQANIHQEPLEDTVGLPHGYLTAIDSMLNTRRHHTVVRGTHTNEHRGHRTFLAQEDDRVPKRVGVPHRLDSPSHPLQQTKIRPLLAYPEYHLHGTASRDLFDREWRHEEKLGQGGDGVVHLYTSMRKGPRIAVKHPLNREARGDIEQEILNMRIVGRHKHILELWLAFENWAPYGPAMISPWCDLGSLTDYRKSWCQRQFGEGQPRRVSEITMYKLFRDMVLALDHLHHKLGTRYVHNDFKPPNILVIRGPDHDKFSIPEEPTFKLADFARLTPWPTPRGKQPESFDGTPEYAPPECEQIAPVQPSADIYGLGATLQYMALGRHPIQSQEAFIRHRKAQGKTFPELMDEWAWKSQLWRKRIPTVFRPIDASLKELRDDYDFRVPQELASYQPYGTDLGDWYRQLWAPVQSRPKASTLVDQIPLMDKTVERLKLERLKKLSLDE